MSSTYKGSAKNFFPLLRAANAARDKEWSEDERSAFTPMFFANGMFGEGGELANLLKKLDRERMGKRGSRAAVEALGEEIADVVIYNDLLAYLLGIEFVTQLPAWPPAGDDPDYSKLGAMLGARIGRACALVDQHAPNYKRVPPQLFREVQYGIMQHCKLIADKLGIDFYKSVATKFNMTSEKLDLKTRIALG